jgi:spermidine synthase
MEIEVRHVDRERTAFGELELREYLAPSGERGFEILLDGTFLMASHGSHAERAMARIAAERLSAPDHERTVLVGGLGAGHTLRAALDLPAVARVVVAEIGAKMVEWNRRFFADVNDAAVDDPRVEIRIDDVAHVVRHERERFDLVLLDVDNGPGWLASAANAWLYTTDGLRTVLASLRPHGVAAVWSPAANPELEATLPAVACAWERVDTSHLGRVEREPGAMIYILRAP